MFSEQQTSPGGIDAMAYSDIEKNELLRSYDALTAYIHVAESQLLEAVQRAIGAIEDKRLVRATIRERRIKSVESIRRNAEANGWRPTEACLSVSDLVGIRVVCNTVDDVYRFRELLREALPSDQYVEEQDYIANAKESGYRALHLNFRVEVGSPLPGSPLRTLRLPCEVQIRTLLQDSWAELVHSDFYKDGSALPEDLRERTLDLATALDAADRTASRIRARAMQLVRAPALAAPNSLTKDSLAHAFSEVFGRWPPEYAVVRALAACQNLGVVTIADFRVKLSTKNLRDALSQAYSEEIRFGSGLGAEEIFALIPVAVAKGDDEALREASELAREHREEIDAVWRREVLSSLPDNYQEFIDDLTAGNIDLLQISEALNVRGKCYCGESVVDDDAFAEAVADHYGVDLDDELIATLHNVADFWANPDFPKLCSYHAYQAGKDD